MEEIRISSLWTKPLLILLTLLWVITPIVLLLSAGIPTELEFGHFAAIFVFLLLLGIALFLTFSLAEVKVLRNEIKFKKTFGDEFTYSFEKIGVPSSFRYKRMKFTSIEMIERSGITRKFLILNNNALLSGEKIDAEKILWELRKKGRNSNS